MGHNDRDDFLVENHVMAEATASKTRAREQLMKMIEESKTDTYCDSLEWTDMSPSGEFEAILA